MTRNFGQEIKAEEERLDAIFKQMEGMRQKFVTATIELIEPWYLSQTESLVKRKPEVTKELGLEKLSHLKAEVKTLQKETASIVAEFLQDERLWWHRIQGNQLYVYYGNRSPDGLDKAVRLVAGRLAPILEEYGYLSNSLHSYEVWREYDQSGNHHPHNARPYYPYAFDWSEQMKTLINRYQELHQKARYQAQKIEGLKQEKAQSEAENLWREA